MKIRLIIPVLVSAVLLSIPWLVPHTGFMALFALVPLLCADSLADMGGCRRFFLYHFAGFVLWNALTTFWVCNATVGGGIFAILCNALQMSLVWTMFRLSKRVLKGVLPYLFLAVMWIAWERLYFNVDISWPWLVLGNAFAGSTGLVQWYDITGHLGGSLWVWASNLVIFGMFRLLAEGRWHMLRPFAKVCAIAGTLVVTIVPMFVSVVRGNHLDSSGCGSMDVVIAQPNFNPYQKFGSMTQFEQNEVLLGLWEEGLTSRTDSSSVLLLAPETFTSDISLPDVFGSPTVSAFNSFLGQHPGVNLLFGASTDEFFDTRSAPSPLAWRNGPFWIESHNSAFMMENVRVPQVYHKSKLVVGVEKLPYPKIFGPVEQWLSRMMGVYALAGRCVGQDGISVLKTDNDVPVGCAICYESVYGDFCRDYVNKGAQLMTVITNDAWWGDTPGYRQHMNYSRLRAIELRRDIARCANTGISAIINRKGEVVSRTGWWEREVLCGQVHLYSGVTPFVRFGDVTGRACTFAFLLLALLAVARIILGRWS